MMFHAMPKILSAPAIATPQVTTHPRAASEQHADDRVAGRGERRQPALAAARPPRDAAMSARIASSPNQPATSDAERLAGDVRRADQEERDHHADHGAAGRLPSRRGRRSPERVQELDRRREREQPADARGGHFGSEGGEDREDREPERDRAERGDRGASGRTGGFGRVRHDLTQRIRAISAAAVIESRHA